ncbi:hypothetical protein [Lysinibacillus xylanilyticus]|uniref:hypothetical protein n=1 Tax=Lysinibacillus xylanilyticus TaxID=582475 RepID=UPI0036DD367A
MAVKTENRVQSVLVKYFMDLQVDPDTPYPEELGDMNQSGIDFEVSKLYEYMRKDTTCRDPYIMDTISEHDIIRLFESPDDNIRISALLSIMDKRIPQLQLGARV